MCAFDHPKPAGAYDERKGTEIQTCYCLWAFMVGCRLHLLSVCHTSIRVLNYTLYSSSFRFVVLPSSTYLFTAGVEGFSDFI
jgi:hypothetical protein